jgi:integrase
VKGSVYRRNKTWTVVYDETPADGGRSQRSKGGFRTRKEAQQFLNEQLQRLDAGTYTGPSKLTVSEFLVGEWLPAVRGTLRPLSYEKYEQAVRLYLVPRLGRIRLQALGAGQINGAYNDLEAAGLSVSTRRVVHAVLRRALRDAVRWGRLARNPAAMADPPATARGTARAWTESELRRFLAHVADDPWFAFWRLAATTGMRRGELGGLTWRAVDLDGGRVTVEQQLSPTPGGMSLEPPKSARSRRTIALDAETVRVLRAHRDTQLLERALAGDAYEDRDLVFADALGGAIHPQRWTKAFREHRARAGIPTGTLHILRHTAATIALTRRMPVHLVAQRLGDRPETVLRVYSHLLPRSDEQVAGAIAEALVSVP